MRDISHSEEEQSSGLGVLSPRLSHVQTLRSNGSALGVVYSPRAACHPEGFIKSTLAGHVEVSLQCLLSFTCIIIEGRSS